MAIKRCFISVELPDEVINEIERLQRELPEFEGKITEEENLHLTLKFLGEISELKIDKIKQKLNDVKLEELNCKVNGVGVFSSDHIKIIWIGLSGCEELQKEVDIKLEGFFKREKRFMGHITIARVKNVRDKKKFIQELKKLKINPINFKIDRFFLRESILHPEGPEYKILGEFPLKKKYD